MTNDLFLSDKDKLKQYLLRSRYHSTSDIIHFGSTNFSNRANRNKQVLVQEGFLRRLSDDEALRLFGNCNQGYYETVDFKEFSKELTTA